MMHDLGLRSRPCLSPMDPRRSAVSYSSASVRTLRQYCLTALKFCNFEDQPQLSLYFWAGNICRSPTAEAVFRKVVEEAGEQDRFFIDSCGTGGGNPDWCLHSPLFWPH